LVGGDFHARGARHFGIAFPFAFGFPGGGTTLYAGGEGRIYFRGVPEQFVQPFAVGGGVACNIW